jgi:hypothetical protein
LRGPFSIQEAAKLPTDSNGNFTLPAGYLAITGQTIQASQHNPPLEDIAAALSGRMPRNGAAPMTGVLKVIDGTETAPGVAFNTAAGTGWYKTTNGFGFSVGGVLICEVTDDGFFPQRLKITGAADNGAGLIRLTLADTSLLSTNQIKTVSGIVGTTEANGTWLITVTGPTTIDLQGSAFVHAYTSGGFLGNGVENTTLGAGVMLTPGSPAVISSDTIPLPRGYINGCELSNGTDATNDINIAAGVCRDKTNAVNITVAAMAGKQLDSNWAPGANAGMRNSAVGIANGTYHLYAVSKADATQDVYAHTSTVYATVLTALHAEAGGADYLYARYIGSIVRTAGVIIPFSQEDDEFLLRTIVRSVTDLNSGTAAVLRTLNVPTGIQVRATVDVAVSRGTGGVVFYLLATSPDQTDVTATTNRYSVNAGLSGTPAPVFVSRMNIRTNTSSQIRTRQDDSDAQSLVEIFTHGWTVPRASL